MELKRGTNDRKLKYFVWLHFILTFGYILLALALALLALLTSLVYLTRLKVRYIGELT